MAESKIDLGGLPVAVPGEFDYLVGTQLGDARRWPLPEVNNAAALLASALDDVVSQAEADIAPVIESLGYLPPVAYEAGMSLTSTRQTVDFNGQVYAPIATELPFITSGVFETDKFRLVQSSLIHGSALSVESVGHLVLLPPSQLINGMQVLVNEYTVGSGVGSAEYYWDASSTTSADGGSVLAAVGVAVGRWKIAEGSRVTPYNFGARNTGDSHAELQAFFDFCQTNGGRYSLAVSGNFQSSGALTLENLDGETISFAAKITLTSPVLDMFTFKNCLRCNFNGRFEVIGTGYSQGGGSISGSTCTNGFRFELCAGSRFAALAATSGRGWGAYVAEGNSNSLKIDQFRALDFGSSARSNRDDRIPIVSGSSTHVANAVSQRTHLVHDSDWTFPSDVIGNKFIEVNGFPYLVKEYNLATRTISVFPTMPDVDIPSGLVKFCYGGGIAHLDGYSANSVLGVISTLRCGTGMQLGGNAPFVCNSFTSELNGVGMSIGGAGQNTPIHSASFGRVYLEAEELASVIVVSTTSSFLEGVNFGSLVSSNLSEYFVQMPRDSAGNRTPLRFFPINMLAGGNLITPETNRDLYTDNNYRPIATTAVLGSRDRWLIAHDSPGNFAVDLVDDVNYRRIKGNKQIIIDVYGAGAAGAPPGVLSFRCEAGYTVNGLVATASGVVTSTLTAPTTYFARLELGNNWRVTKVPHAAL